MHIALLAAAAALVLSGCGPIFGGGDEKIVIPGEITRVFCPDQLVNVNLPARPAKPAWGDGAADLADEGTFTTRLEAYLDALERQAAAREQQVAECKESRRRP